MGGADVGKLIRVRRVVRSAARRLWLAKTAGALSRSLLVAGVAFFLLVGAERLGWLEFSLWVVGGGLLAVAVAAGSFFGWRGRVSSFEAAGVIDRVERTRDRLRNGLELERTRGAFASLARRDAERAAEGVRARSAPGPRADGWTWAAVAVSSAGVLLAVLAPRRDLAGTPLAPDVAPEVAARAQAVPERLRDSGWTSESAREAAFEAAAAIEDELAAGREPEEALAGAASKLEAQADVLEDDAEAAREEARSLAERLRSDDAPDTEAVREVWEELARERPDAALEALDRLRQRADTLSPDERERIAEDLRSLAEASAETESVEEGASSDELASDEPSTDAWRDALDATADEIDPAAPAEPREPSTSETAPRQTTPGEQSPEERVPPTPPSQGEPDRSPADGSSETSPQPETSPQREETQDQSASGDRNAEREQAPSDGSGEEPTRRDSQQDSSGDREGQRGNGADQAQERQGQDPDGRPREGASPAEQDATERESAADDKRSSPEQSEESSRPRSEEQSSSSSGENEPSGSESGQSESGARQSESSAPESSDAGEAEPGAPREGERPGAPDASSPTEATEEREPPSRDASSTDPSGGEREQGSREGSADDAIERVRRAIDERDANERDARRLRETAREMSGEPQPGETERMRGEPNDGGDPGTGRTRDPRLGGGAAGDENRDESTAPWDAGDERAFETDVVDARGEEPMSPDDTPTTVAEWLAPPDTDAVGEASGASSASSRRVLDRAREALEAQPPPARYRDVVKRVFDRYGERLDGRTGASEGPSSAPADAADAPRPSPSGKE
ncbi:MAG: hypothetical protein AAGK04_08780 [Planctomycetota bacterium]